MGGSECVRPPHQQHILRMRIRAALRSVEPTAVGGTGVRRAKERAWPSETHMLPLGVGGGSEHAVACGSPVRLFGVFLVNGYLSNDESLRACHPPCAGAPAACDTALPLPANRQVAPCLSFPSRLRPVLPWGPATALPQS